MAHKRGRLRIVGGHVRLVALPNRHVHSRGVHMKSRCLAFIAAAAPVFVLKVGAQSPETRMFAEAAPSVVRVEAGLGSGSGFFVGDNTTIATNSHVVAEAETVSVYVTPTHRVPARVIVRDDARDLAILQIPSEGCDSCRPLPLADDSVLVIGLPVVVMGYPLGQPLTITRGIVATLRSGALLTDAAINAGNSGGPILSASGSVVAIATFSDPDPRGGVSAGLGGAVLASGLRPLLVEARAAIRPWHDSTSLPILPVDEYAPSLLASIADTASPVAYDRLSGIDIGPFTVRVSTPLSHEVLELETGRRVASNRRRRESAAGVPIQDRYNALVSVHDWMAYVGNEHMPVVQIIVEPNSSETFMSAFARGFTKAAFGTAGPATIKFDGDVRGVILRRNGEIVTSLRGGHTPEPVNVDNEWFSFWDVADMGIYIYSPSAFRPNPDGSVPSLELDVRDLKSPTKVRKQKLDDAVVARVWNDFASYYQALKQPFAAFSFTRKCAAVDRGMGATETVCEDIVGPAK